jgi:hypothetical protein
VKLWAWIWLGALALIGWAPALLLSYIVAVVLALGMRLQGRTVIGLTFALILMIGLVMMVQVRRYFTLHGREALWYTWAGGAVLVGVWGAAFAAFTLSTGIFP